jgi:hypothetical protein
MPSSISGGGFNQPSQTTAGLKAISSETYPFVNKDFVKNIAYLNQATDSLATWAQTAQSGIDNASKNPIEQIQGILSDIMVLLAGGEPTGMDLGDLKYIIQSWGALLGINPDTPFPLNLVQAVSHLFEQYILPLPQLTDLIYDSLAAWAEQLGMSDDAVNSIEDFSAAVVNYYNDRQDLGDQFDISTQEFFKKFKLAKSTFDNSASEAFWDNVGASIQSITEATTDTLLNVLSDIVVVLFKSMTWVVNAFNPRTSLESFGISFLGPQIAPVASSNTNIWTVVTDANTGWIFDNSTTKGTAAGSFKTNGNSTNKRLLNAVTQQCAVGDVYNFSAWVKWASIPAAASTAGICMVFYNNTTEVSQHNIDLPLGHGASGDWAEIKENITVPANANGFKIGARVTSAITSGSVWADEISCLKQLPLGEGAVQGILDNIPIISDLAEIFSGQEDGNLNDIGTWVNSTVSDITTVWNSFFGKHQNGPSMVLDPNFETASMWQYEPGVQTTEQKMSGTYSRKLTGPSQSLYFSAAGINNRNSIPAHGFRCVPRQKFTISCYARRHALNGPLGQANIGVILYPGTGVGGIAGQDTIVTAAAVAQLVWLPGIWVNFKNTYTVPDTNANGEQYTHIVPFFGTSSAVGANDYFYLDDLSLKDVTENQDVINAINTAMGASGTDAASVQSALQAIPGPNIGTAVNASVVPALDATKITTGSLGTARIPNLDAAKITTGTLADSTIPTLAQSKITSLTTDLNGKVSTAMYTTAVQSGANLVLDPQLENASVWTYGGMLNTGVTHSSEDFRSGSKCLKFVGPSQWAYFCGSGYGAGTHIYCVPGDRFYLEFWAKCKSTNAGGGTMSACARVFDSTGVNAMINDTTWTIRTTVANPASGATWAKFSGYVTIPTGYDRFQPYIVSSAIPALDVIYVDDLMIREVTESQEITQALYNSTVTASTVIANAVPSLDATKITTGTLGTTQIPNLDATKITTGTLGTTQIPNLDAAKVTTGNFAQGRVTNLTTDLTTAQSTATGAATAIALAAKDFTNLVPASDFEGTNPWSLTGATATFSIATDQYFSGTKSLKIVGESVLANNTITFNNSQMFECKAGEQFYMECMARRSSTYTDSSSTGPRIRLVRGNGANMGQTIGNINLHALSINPADTWVKLSMMITIPSDATTCSLMNFMITGPPLNISGSIWVDDIIVRRVVVGGQIADSAVSNVKLGTDISGDKIVAGTVTAPRIGALDASKITTGTLSTSLIPSLDAGKITTGTLVEGLLPPLDASNIVGGTFTTAQIPSLDAGKITTGALGTARIPALPASQITSGTFTATQIPSLDGSKISSGTVGATYIPSLDASKITTGTLGTAIVPNLDGSKITTGSVAAARVANLAQSQITNLSTDLGNVNAIASSAISAGENLITNPGFDNPLFYAAGGSWSTEQAYTGTYSWKYVCTVADWPSPFFTSITGGVKLPCKADETFYVEFQIFPHINNGAGTTTGFRFYLRVNDKAGGQIGTPGFDINTSTLTKGVWSKVGAYMSWSSLAAAVNFNANFSVNVSESGNTYYIDNPIIYRVTESAQTNQALYGSNTTASTVQTSVVPALDASKITTGALGTAQIPNLDGAKITTGSVAAARVANLAQSQITNLGTDLGAIDDKADAAQATIDLRAKDFENLAAGGDFEGTTQPFTLGVGFSIATDQFYSGSKSLKRTGNATATTAGVPVNPVVQPGDQFYIEFWARRDAAYNGGSGSSKFRIGYNAALTYVDALFYDTVTLTQVDTWVKMSKIVTAPAGANYLVMYFSADNTAGNIWFDDVIIRRVKPAITIPTLDGSKIGSGSVAANYIAPLDGSKITTGSVAAARVANLAQSQITSLPTDLAAKLESLAYDSFISGGENLCTNPSFEDATQYTYDGVYDTTIKRTGSRSIKLTGNGSSNRYVTLANNKSTFIFINAKPSQVFYVEAWVYGDPANTLTGTTSVGGVGIWAYDATNAHAYVGPAGTVQFTPDQIGKGSWVKISGVVTASSTSTVSEILPQIYLNAAATAGNSWYFDNVVVKNITELASTNTALYGANTPATTIITGAVPGLDGSKITGGTVASNFIAALDAAKITTGTFTTTQIPTLDGAKIGSGTVGATYIPSLDASKITTGTLGTAIVPNLDAGKITTGTLGDTRIPTLAQSKITSLGTDLGNRVDYSAYQAYLSGGPGNICTNPGFEDTTQYNYGGYGIHSTTIFRGGARSMGLAGTGAIKYIALSTNKTAEVWIKSAPSQKFYVEFYVYGDNANTLTGNGCVADLWMLYYTAGGTYLTAVGIGTASPGYTADQIGKNAWAKVSGYCILPSTSTIAYVRPLLALQASVTAGNTYYFDDFYIENVTNITATNRALFNLDTAGTTILGTAVPALDGSKITTGTIGTAIIPNLDASKITTGTIGTSIVPSLDAGKITTGTFTVTQIPTIDGSKIGSGTVGATYIPSLDASKITTGTLGTTQIPSLDAAKITTGALGTARIPSLPASQITSGTFGTAYIADSAITGIKTAGLDASKITSGTMAQAQVTSLSTDLGNRVDYTTYTQLVAGAPENVCTNPGFEDSSQYVWAGAYNTNAAFVRSGARSVSLTGTGVQQYVTPCATKTAEIYFQGAPSSKWYFEFYVWCANAVPQTGATASVGIGIWSYTAALANVTSTGYQYSFDTISTGVWTKCNGYITIPSTSTIAKLRILLYVTAAATSGTYYFDDVFLKDVTEIVNTNQALYGANAPASTVLTGAVPALDASKITTGTLGTGIVPNLDAGKITTGSLATARIPSLPASQITSGTFTTTQIPSLPASQITSGTLAVATIPALDAAKIATGTFVATQIPVLDATKITTGTLGTGQIPNLDAGKITTGTLGTTQIPNLDAGKITTGTISTARVPDITKAMSTDLQGTLNNITDAWTGSSGTTGSALSNALDAMRQIYTTITEHSRDIAALKTQKSGYSAKGTYTNIDFGSFDSGAMPSIFTLTYTGAGTSTLGIASGVAQWTNTNNADRSAKLIYNVAPTNTDFQVLRGTMTMAPQEAIGGGTPKFHALGRVSADGNSYVWCRGYCNGWFQYRGDIGYTVNGVETVWASNISLTWSMDMTFVLGVGTNARQYQVYSAAHLYTLILRLALPVC